MRKGLALVVVALIALALPVLALDSRCETQPDRPFCQPNGGGGETPGTTTTVPEMTTTTQPPTTTSTPTPDPFDAVAVIGCSNTYHSTTGYLDASEIDLLVNTAAAGHTVEYWATRQDGWDEYYLPPRPADGFDGVWFNLCERAEAGLTQENAEAVLAKIWEIDPGIPVWVSPLNFYETDECAVTGGNTIPDEGTVIADSLAAEFELVERGPDLGPLTADMLRTDQCHPNRIGVEFLGAQLVGFFDA